MTLICRACAQVWGCLEANKRVRTQFPGTQFSVNLQRRGICRRLVRAAVWTPNRDLVRPKGYDRPWVENNGQPVLAPRTQDMAGDPFGLLLRQRIIFIGGEVEDFSADALISQLLLLDAQDQNKDVKVFINSPGEQYIRFHLAWRIVKPLSYARAHAMLCFTLNHLSSRFSPDSYWADELR